MTTGTDSEGGVNTTGTPVVVRTGTKSDIDAIKAIADREKDALGFVHRGALVRAAGRNELVIASIETVVVGFCQLYRRQDGIITVYHFAVVSEARGLGIGRALLAHLAADARTQQMKAIRLKCPSDLPANDFYARNGFKRMAVDAGKARPLSVWEYHVSEARIYNRSSSVE